MRIQANIFQSFRMMGVAVILNFVGWLAGSAMGQVAESWVFYQSFDEYWDGAETDDVAKWGGSLDVTATDAPAMSYPVAGAFPAERGTIEFFARIEDFGGNWQNHRFFSLRDAAGEDLFSAGVHPQDEHLIFDWQWGGTNGWFHIKNDVQAGQWHHYAIVWNASDGWSQVYVDGKRKGKSDEIRSLAAAPDRLIVGRDPAGRRPLIGYIDDLAIASDVRYDQPFSPRTKPLDLPITSNHSDLKPQDDPMKPSLADAPVNPPVDALHSASADALLVNGDFEMWEDGLPVGWSVDLGTYEADAAFAFNGNTSLRMTPLPEQDQTFLFTRIKQDVELEPGKRFRLGLRMAKETSGKVMIRVRALKNNRVVADDPPLDWNNGWSRFFTWTPISLDFTTGSGRDYEISIMQFGNPDGSAWIDSVEINPAEQQVAAAATPSADIVLTFSPSTLLPLPTVAPPAASRTDRIFVALSAQEYEPVTLAMHASRDLERVTAELVAELVGPDGKSLPAESVTIRNIEGELLPLMRPRSVMAGQNLGWWITVHATADTSPGLYMGTVNLKADGSSIRQIALQVRVESFVLPEPDITMGVYHNERYFPAANMLTKELRAAYYRDIREHGMNTVTVYNNPHAKGDTLDYSRNYASDPAVVDVDALNKRGYQVTEQEIEERFEWGLEDVMPMIAEAGLGSPEHPLLWLHQKPGNYGWGGMPAKPLQDALTHWLDRTEWPAPLLYVQDEPNGYPDRIADARRILDNLKDWNIPVPTVTADVAVEELGEDYDIWIQLERRVTPEMHISAKEKGAKLWAYNCNMPTDNAPFTRALFGFWAYRANVGGVLLWAYYDGLTWYMDEDGNVHGKNGPFGLGRICPSPDGPIPTVSWETSREGIDDYRYAMLFDKLIEKLVERGEALRREAVAELDDKAITKINADLKRLERKITDETPPIAWSPTDDSEAAAEEKYQQAHQIEFLVKHATQARQQVIASVPSDAMSALAAVPYITANSQFYPELGAGDRRTSADAKRRILRGYIRRMHQALDEFDTINKQSQ